MGLVKKFFNKSGRNEEGANPYARQQPPESHQATRDLNGRSNGAAAPSVGSQNAFALPSEFKPAPNFGSRPPMHTGYRSDTYGASDGYGVNVYDNEMGRPGNFATARNGPDNSSLPGRASTRVSTRANSFNTSTTLVARDDDGRNDHFDGAQKHFGRKNLDDDDIEEQNRNELFGGARERFERNDVEQNGVERSSSFNEDNYDGPDGYGSQRELTFEEQEEQILMRNKDQKNNIRDETIQIATNMNDTLDQATALADSVLGRHQRQDQDLWHSYDQLKIAKANANVAKAGTEELRTLNRSMFAVHVSNPFGKKERRELEEKAVVEESDRFSKERSADRMEAFQAHRRMEDARNDLRVKYDSSKPVARDNKYHFDDDESEDEKKEDTLAELTDKALFNMTKINRAVKALNQELDRTSLIDEKLPEVTDSTGSILKVAQHNMHRTKT